jgi:hypothetical protein
MGRYSIFDRSRRVVAKFPHFHPNITHQAGSTRKRCWSPAQAGLLAALIGVQHGLRREGTR